MKREDFFNQRIVVYAAAVLMSMIWGMSFIATKAALAGLSVTGTLCMRWTAAAAVCLLLMALKVIKVKFRGKPLKLLIVAVLMQPGIYAIFETLGIALTTTTESAILIALSPIVVALLTIVVLRQRISATGIFGILFAFAGIVVNAAFSSDFSLGGKWLGYVSLLLAVLSGAVFILLSKKISADGHFSAIEITVAMSFAGAIIFNIVSLLAGNGTEPYITTFTQADVGLAVLFLGAGCSAICYILFNYVVEKLPPHQASALQVNLITITGVISGVILLGDDFGWYTVCGLAMMLGGIMILSQTEK